MRLEGTQKYYALGQIQLLMELEGSYGNLPPGVVDNIAAAAHTAIAQLPLWVDGATANQPSNASMQSGNIPVEAKFYSEAKDDDGTFRVTLKFSDVPKDAIPRSVAQGIADSATRSFITEKLIYSVGSLTLHDPFAQSRESQLSTMAADASQSRANQASADALN